MQEGTAAMGALKARAAAMVVQVAKAVQKVMGAAIGDDDRGRAPDTGFATHRTRARHRRRCCPGGPPAS